MRRVLKNRFRGHISNWFRGREVWFKSRTSRIFDMDNEEEKAEYYFWKTRYGFIEDITDRPDIREKLGGDKNETN